MAVSTDQLHTHAIEAEKHLEQLATGLAEIGADPAAVKAISQMADVTRKIASGLAKGGTQDEPEKPTMDQELDNHMAERRPPAPPA